MKGLKGKNVLVTGSCSEISQTIFIDGGLTLFADFRTAWSSE